MTSPNHSIDIFDRRVDAPRYKLIACEVIYREACFVAASSPNVIDLEFLSQGLHDLQSESMRDYIQERIDASDQQRYQAILLGFALCNGGLLGVQARNIPMILPRAHDCITFFLGSKEAYRDYFETNHGTYYLTTGWLERDRVNLENTIADENNRLHRMGLDKSCEEYVAMYGEKNARMIMQTLTGMHHYDKLCHIDMGFAPQAEQRVLDAARAEARRRGWTCETRPGDMGLLHALVDGTWDDERFLRVQPGHRIEQVHDDRIVCSRPGGRCATRSKEAT